MVLAFTGLNNGCKLKLDGNLSRILVYANHTIVKYSFDYDIMTEWAVLFIATCATERERGGVEENRE